MDNERLKEIRDSELLLHDDEEWTNQEDADTEAVIKELIAAVDSPSSRNCGLGETLANLVLIGCAVLVAAAVLAVVMVVVYFVCLF